MAPLVALGLIGGGGFLAYKKFGKKTTQGMPSGTPGVFVVSPVPNSVTHAQATSTVTKPTTQSHALVPTPAGGHKPIATTVHALGLVYSPPDAVQPGQSLPIIMSPTGSSAIGLSSTSDVQRALNTLGIQPLLKVDGKLGPNTSANIRSFQSSHGMLVDGNAGPATKMALAAALSNLAAGPKASVAAAVAAVTPATAPNMTSKDVQHLLNILGANPHLDEDGKLGPKSVSAIKSFQVSHGLTPDGIAGPKTKAALALATKGT